MKHQLTALAAAALLGASTAHAATITSSIPGGISYRHNVTMGAVDFVTFTNSVGAWSWEDQTLFNAALGETPVGWTHESAWMALTLSSEAYVTLRVESATYLTAGTNLIPGFTVFTGFDDDAIPDSFPEGAGEQNWHTYNNRGNVLWAEDMTYYAHAEPNGTNVIERTYLLPAGQYSVVFGGNANSTSNPGVQGYLTTVTTVPEPGSAVLALAGGLALFTRRRNSSR
jgi:hypothetical protein